MGGERTRTERDGRRVEVRLQGRTGRVQTLRQERVGDREKERHTVCKFFFFFFVLSRVQFVTPNL